MKRFNMFLVPLFAMPLLVGCKIGNLENTYCLRFDSTNSIGCHMEINGETKDAEITDQKVTAKIVPEGEFTFPITIVLTNDEDKEYTGDKTYDENTGELTIKMIENVTIVATATPKES